MKTYTIIIQYDSSKSYFGYIYDFPAICAQADSVDDVISSLNTCAKYYFVYISKNC